MSFFLQTPEIKKNVKQRIQHLKTSSHIHGFTSLGQKEEEKKGASSFFLFFLTSITRQQVYIHSTSSSSHPCTDVWIDKLPLKNQIGHMNIGIRLYLCMSITPALFHVGKKKWTVVFHRHRAQTGRSEAFTACPLK